MDPLSYRNHRRCDRVKSELGIENPSDGSGRGMGEGIVEEVIRSLLQVDTIVVSYHGVVVPPVVPRFRALPDEAVVNLLTQLRRKYKVILVSFRSYSAIYKTADAFDASICCNGCEIVTPEDIIVPRKTEEYTHMVLDIFRKLRDAPDVTIELRKTRFGDAVGLSIEWNGRLSTSSQDLIYGIVGQVSQRKPVNSKCLTVYADSNSNYIEIFAPVCRRARALNILRKLMDLGKVAYIGEGLIDNEVLRSVDVPIAVIHDLNKSLADKIFAKFKISRSDLLYALKMLAASI
ncbi:MAG: hypothetical protein GXO32_06190 [Crenarchaeota archaeon]|nr:hypothetical protein [Thermoproteota archaeon]